MIRRRKFLMAMAAGLLILSSSSQERPPTLQEKLAAHLSDVYNHPVEKMFEVAVAVYRYADEYSIEPAIILAIIHKESHFNHMAKNPASSASGIMQVLAYTHRSRFDRPKDVFKIEHNIRAGVEILAEQLSKRKTIKGALVGYSGGSTTYANAVIRKSKQFQEVLDYYEESN